MNWHCVNVRLQGTGHIASGLPCQDFSLCEQFPIKEAPILISLVADGAGSASDGGRGAQIACEVILRAIKDWVDEWTVFAPVFTDELVRIWVREAHDRVIAAAEAVGKSPRDFACTLLGSVLVRDSACYFQLGDGAIVAWNESASSYEPVFWPQSGEYSNTTFFLSEDDWVDKIMIDLTKAAPKEFAMFSDGLQGLLLVSATQKAHQPFFQKSFALLRAPERPKEEVQQELEKTFRSPKVTERTDDDISFVMVMKHVQ